MKNKKMYEPFNRVEPVNWIEVLINVVGATSIFALTYMMWVLMVAYAGVV